MTIDLPPLRERREDIPLLMAHFCRQAAQRYGRPVPDPDPELVARWQAYDWPGNVRQLKNIADRLALGLAALLPPAGPREAAGGVMGGVVDGAGETPDSPAAADLGLAARMDAVEKRCIEAALRECGGQVSRAAERLQLPKKTLYDKLHRHGIDPERFRAGPAA